jgi:hypothetical protein
MKRLLATICFLSACSGPGGPSIAYEPPSTTPYDARPLLKEQYLKAHRAAWNRQVSEVTEEWLEKRLQGNEAGSSGSHLTCCEATRNVTRGWYRGLDDGNRFVARIAVKSDRPKEILEQFRRLKKDIEDHPVRDWFVLDAYTPADLVEVPEQDGALIRVYRDATRTKLHEVRRVRDGKNHGKCESYDANGVLHSVSTWVDGIQNGEEITVSDSGDVVGYAVYHGDQRDGLEIWWDEEGKPTRCFRWKGGKEQGRCLVYQGQDVRVDVYDAGVKIDSGTFPVATLPEDERPSTLDRLKRQIRR